MAADPAETLTTDARLQSVLDDLAHIDRTDLADQAARYERMHTALADLLGTTVERPGAEGR
jgi:hypothetical protein